MRIALPALLVLCATLAPRAGHAQFRDQLYTTPVLAPAVPVPAPNATLVLMMPMPANARRDEHRVSIPAMALAGYLGSLAGAGAGLLIGLQVDDDPHPECIDVCVKGWGAASLLAGEVLGTALGVHLANGRRGSFSHGLLLSAGILAAGEGILLATDTPELFGLIPLAQIAGAVWAEAATTPRD